MLTLDSTIKSVVATLNIGNTLRKVGKEIGINEKRLSSILKEVGYTYKERKWSHIDYEDPIRERTVRELLTGNTTTFTEGQLEELTLLIDKRIITLQQKELVSLHNALTNLDAINRITRSLGVDKETLNDFEQFCDAHNVVRSRAFTLALKDFLENYSL